MTEQEINKFSIELQEGLRSFVGQPNIDGARSSIIAFIQGKINELYESKQIEFAPLPIIDVEINGGTAQIKFLDPETKESFDWTNWLGRHLHGRK